MRKDLEIQVNTLKDERKIMERERRQLENELRKFMFHQHHQQQQQQQPVVVSSTTLAAAQQTDNNRRNNSMADF